MDEISSKNDQQKFEYPTITYKIPRVFMTLKTHKTQLKSIFTNFIVKLRPKLAHKIHSRRTRRAGSWRPGRRRRRWERPSVRCPASRSRSIPTADPTSRFTGTIRRPAADVQRRRATSTRDRFYKTPFRPKNFRTCFHPQILNEFLQKTKDINLH
jgi:hypothetical protein